MAWQVLWPFRHNFIEGDANWTEEGQDFSWRMMLRAKAAGHATFHVSDKGMQITGTRGQPEIDRSKCPDGIPKAIHIPIDCHLFQWDHHPGTTMTFEPALGARIVYYPAGSTK